MLEPVVRIEVTTPSDATGDITGDLATRRGRISGSQSLAGQRTRISALVPLAELTDYQSRVKSLTGGEGSYTMELSHYDPVPAAQAAGADEGVQAGGRRVGVRLKPAHGALPAGPTSVGLSSS